MSTSSHYYTWWFDNGYGYFAHPTCMTVLASSVENARQVLKTRFAMAMAVREFVTKHSVPGQDPTPPEEDQNPHIHFLNGPFTRSLDEILKNIDVDKILAQEPVVSKVNASQTIILSTYLDG